MYRVVSKTMHIHGAQRRRTIHKGPWQPRREWALQWAEYLRSTGLYDTIEIESNLPGAITERL